jgi:cell volume regulation protein A
MAVGSVALALILFEGGLQTDLGAFTRRLVRSGVLLSTVGVGITAAVIAGFATLVLGMSPLEGLLLGAVLSSTDAAAVFSVLRSRGIGLPARLRQLIEFESGSNDPTAVFLTVSVITVLQSGPINSGLLPLMFVFRMLGGVLLGWIAGLALVRLLNWIDLEHDGLYPVLTLAAAGTVFAAAEVVQTSGFMAVYVTGLTMSSRAFVHKRSLVRFHGGLAWLMQVTMFLALGLLVFPSHLVAQFWPAIGVSVVLIVVARPLAVFTSLIGSGLSVREKTMVSWVGLRGAAPIILATFPMVAGLGASDTIFNTVFVAVIASVLVQGPSVGVVARRLGIAEPFEHVAPIPLELDVPTELGMAITRLRVDVGSEAEGEKMVSIGGPSRPLVVLIRREGWLFIPTGNSRLRADDELYVLGSAESVEEMRGVVQIGTHSDGDLA